MFCGLYVLRSAAASLAVLIALSASVDALANGRAITLPGDGLSTALEGRDGHVSGQASLW
jgi:hypothetical protein